MKRIEATVRMERCGQVLRALQVVGCRRVRTARIQEGNPQPRGAWGGSKAARCGLETRAQVEVFAADGDVDQIIGAILAAARTGERGDGLIVVSTIESAVRIRNGERGPRAIEP